MATSGSGYWKQYYGAVHAHGPRFLDFGDAQSQAQFSALALEACGSVDGVRCLDVGAGRGQVARALDALGAQVSALELVESTVNALAVQHPQIRWRAGDASDPASYEPGATYDRITAIEVLQYVPFASTLRVLLDRLAPGGRLVGVVPNARCPAILRGLALCEGDYRAVDGTTLVRELAALPDLDAWYLRRLHFASDATLVPYDVSPWTRDPTAASEPNRWLFVALRRAAG